MTAHLVVAVIAVDRRCEGPQLHVGEASSMFVAVAVTGIADLRRSSTLDCSKWLNDEWGPVPVVFAALVIDTAVTATGSPSDAVKAGFGAVRRPPADEFVGSWGSRIETVLAVADVHTLVFRDRGTEEKSRKRVSWIAVCCRWEGRVAAWWRLLPWGLLYLPDC